MPDTPDTLMINEFFHSIQGESTWAGLPCTFVRLMGCHLRCRYCDTEYAFHEGKRWTLDAIMDEVARLGGDCRLVQVTGGEPLLQPACGPLTTRLADAGYTVLVETSGACDIDRCDPRAIRIMDFKTPGSGEAHRNDYDNVPRLRPRDEIKFVLTDDADYLWARELIEKHALNTRVHAILMSAVNAITPGEEIPGTEPLSLQNLAAWIIRDNLPVRLQTQLHKLIWPATLRGV